MGRMENLRSTCWRIFISSVFWVLLCSKREVEANEIGTSVAEFRNYDGFDLNERLVKIETKSQQQESEIEFLNGARKEDKELINHLRLRVERLEASANNSHVTTTVTRNYKQTTATRNIIGRQKRPVRLLPPHMFKSKEKEGGDMIEDRRFYGPPTSCSELMELGYTLNGYYLVRSKHNLKSANIEVVYCRFRKPFGSLRSFETFIGSIDVKTKKVHFYVQRNTSLKMANTVISFEVGVLNMGEAMNVKSGIFTAPVSGVYHFEFTGTKDKSDKQLDILLEVNGIHVGEAHSSGALKSTSNLYMTASLRLKEGDRVNLYKSGGILYDSTAHYTHFTGWLVEEDLTSFPLV